MSVPSARRSGCWGLVTSWQTPHIRESASHVDVSPGWRMLSITGYGPNRVSVGENTYCALLTLVVATIR